LWLRPRRTILRPQFRSPLEDFDPQRVAVWLYNPETQTFYTYDDPFTAMLKMMST